MSDECSSPGCWLLVTAEVTTSATSVSPVLHQTDVRVLLSDVKTAKIFLLLPSPPPLLLSSVPVLFL